MGQAVPNRRPGREADLVDSPTDDALMQAVRDGDVARLSVLFERHHRKLFQFFVRLTDAREQSEDLVQEVFFRMLKYRQTYRSGTSFTAWMYQIARNARLDQRQRHKLELLSRDDTDGGSDEPASRELGPEERIRRRQEVALIRRALAELPVDKRELLALTRFQNLKYEEIAQILECEVGAVKVRVYRAVRSLGEVFFRLAGERKGGQAS